MDFLKFRYVAIILSFVIIATGIGFGLTKGFVFDIDFQGGSRIELELKEEFDNQDIIKLTEETINITPIVQELSGGDHSVSITTTTLSVEDSSKLIEALQEKYVNVGDDYSSRNISASFGRELFETAILAIIVSICLILLYVTVRFKVLGFKAAITAVIALIHDALMIIAIYGIFRLPINSTFVAVILTIIGYSINDTIVVYSKIRENKRKVTKSDDLKDTINVSLKQTMRRTLYTSLTTLSTITVVYILATMYNQQVLKEFSFPLILGVVIGTYSSIFIASSFYYMFSKKK